MTDFLVNTCRVKIDYATFGRLNGSGLFVLFLDGLDEMVSHVDAKVTTEIIQSLAELHGLDSRVILTGRPGFFPSREQLESQLRANPTTDAYDRILSEYADHRIPYYTHMYLLPLSTAQILEFVKKREPALSAAGGLTCEQLMKAIRSTYNLADLSERPVLLDLIVKTLPRLVYEIESINVERLYSMYTSFWLGREEEKGRTLISRADKVAFVEQLALQMFLDSRMTVHYRDLGPHIKKHFHISEADTLDHFAHDIRTCSFMNRDSSGNYYFAHKSFMEFFVAKRIASEIQDGKNWNFGRKPLTKEILNFIDLMLSEEHRRALLKWLAAPINVSRGGGRHTAANLMSLLLLHGFDLANVGLRGQIIEEIDLSGASLAGADLRQCRMARCNLAGANLSGAHLERADLTASSLRLADLSDADLQGATLNASDLTGARLYRTNLSGAMLAGIRGWERIQSFQETNLTDVSGLKYEDAELAATKGAVGRVLLSKADEDRKASHDSKKRLQKEVERAKKDAKRGRKRNIRPSKM